MTREIPAELAYPKLVWPTLQVIRERGGSASIEEIEDGVARALALSDQVLSAPHTQGTRTEFQYRLAWVRTYLKKDGVLQNSARAVWSITDRGDSLSEAEARGVFARVNAVARAAQDREETEAPSETSVLAIPDDDQDTWVDRLLEIIGDISPSAFERLAQRLLRESGFTKVEVTGQPGDGGIDGVGILRMNLVSFQVSFQCKRWKGSVGASAVRDFRGAMVGRADKGLIITTGTFTADARREATRDGAPAIDLIDGETLCHLLKERRLGVNVEMVEEVTLDETFLRSI
ncbi:MAG: restriction endonuclease [Hyphomonadaceae bacterium]|nr:restriction endonuclease [Hyphomonadaceae bacterium]